MSSDLDKKVSCRLASYNVQAEAARKAIEANPMSRFAVPPKPTESALSVDIVANSLRPGDDMFGLGVLKGVRHVGGTVIATALNDRQVGLSPEEIVTVRR